MPNTWLMNDLGSLVLLNLIVFSTIACSYFLYKKFSSTKKTSSVPSLTGVDPWEKVSQNLFQTNGRLSPETTLSSIMEMVASETHLDCAMLTRYNSANDMEVLYVMGEENPWKKGDHIGAQDSYCSRTVTSVKPLCVEYAAVSEWRNHQAYKTNKIESYIGVKVYFEEHVFGVLSFFSKKSHGQIFAEKEKSLVSSASKWVALAMRKEASLQGRKAA